MKRLIQLAVLFVAVLVFASCAWSPKDDDTGSVTLAFSLPAGGVSGSAVVGDDTGEIGKGDADTARIALYYYGVELPIGPNRQGYVDVGDVVDGTRTFTIDNLPEGDGYRISVILAQTDAETSVLLPVANGFSPLFTITGGRETAVGVTTTQLDSYLGDGGGVRYYDSLIGENLVGAVYTPLTGVVAASAAEVFAPEAGLERAISSLSSTVASAVDSISLGQDLTGSVKVPFLNTDQGILPLAGASGSITAVTSILSSMSGILTGAENVTGSGMFAVDTTGNGSSDTVAYFYQRLGGLGGSAVTSGSVPSAGDWVDTGSDFADLIEEGQSPVYAQVTSGLSAAYISSVLGTFKLTQELFEGGDIEVSELLDPESDTSGLTFFSVAYPGSNRPLKIRHMALTDVEGVKSLVIGAPRGAFVLPVEGANDALDSAHLPNNRLVANSLVAPISAVLDQEVIDLTAARVGDAEFVVVVTNELILVVNSDEVDVSRSDALLAVPTRSVTLGDPQSVFAFTNTAGVLSILVAGSEGLTRIDLDVFGGEL